MEITKGLLTLKVNGQYIKVLPITTADLITETTTRKFMTVTEKQYIEDYLKTFNVANKLVKLGFSGKIASALMPQEFDLLTKINVPNGLVQLMSDSSLDINKINTDNIRDRIWSQMGFSQYGEINAFNKHMRINYQTSVGIRTQTLTFGDDNNIVPDVTVQPTERGLSFNKPVESVFNPDTATAETLVPKSYVDNVVSKGVKFKEMVLCASDTPINLINLPATIDGVNYKIPNARVLLCNQTVKAENGIYTWNGSKLIRINEEYKNVLVSVLSGSINKGHQKYTENNDLWVNFYVYDDYTESATIAINGRTLGVKPNSINDTHISSVNSNKLIGTITQNQIDTVQTIVNTGYNVSNLSSSVKTLHLAIQSIAYDIKGLFFDNNVVRNFMQGREGERHWVVNTIIEDLTLCKTKSTIRMGEAVPNNALGQDGDMYIQIV